MAITTKSCIIALHDGIGELITPTANFTPVSGKPLSNLTSSNLLDRCRTPDLTTDRQLTWNFAGLTSANVFMLAGTNATISTLRRFRNAADSGFTASVVESGATLTAAFDDSLNSGVMVRYVPPLGRTLVYVHPATFTNPYCRWHQSDTTNPDGYMEWGIARIGLAWQPVGGFESASWKKAPKPVGNPGAQKLLRGHELTFHNLSKAEAYQLESLTLATLNGRRMLVIPEGMNTETYLSDALWCELESDKLIRELVGNYSFGQKRYKYVLTFREVER